jgi:hypothetical protein
MVTIINIKQCPDFNPKLNPKDVYIGRFHRSRYGFFLRSRWHNPFKVGKDGSREGVIELYKSYVLSHPELASSLHELKNKRLGCWCKPEPCHGDALVELIEHLG